MVVSLILGIIGFWFGFLITVMGAMIRKGAMKAREYNYRPLMPKFMRVMSDEELEKINRPYSAKTMWCGLLWFVLSPVIIYLGWNGNGQYALPLFILPVIVMLLISLMAFLAIYQYSKKRTNDPASLAK